MPTGIVAPKFMSAPLFLAFSALAVTSGSAAAQEPMVSITPRTQPHPHSSQLHPNLRVDSTMVLVPVTVTDSTDHPVTGLEADSFRVFQDNVEQKIVGLHQEEGPVSVGFIFDASSSMKGRMDRSIAAVQQFLKTLNPGDEFFLIRFSDRPTLITGFTDKPDDILSSLLFIQPDGWTALNDSICLGLQQMRHARNPRRALFVLTDGGDNNSRYSEAEVRDLAQESDVRIYSIGLFERPHFLERLAMDTGGRAIWAHKLQALPEAVDKLSRAFRSQYVLSYSSEDRLNDGKYHNIRVELMKTIKLMQLNVFWRRGYFAPSE